MLGSGARKGWDAADRGTKGPEKPCKVTTGGNLKKKKKKNEDIPPPILQNGANMRQPFSLKWAWQAWLLKDEREKGRKINVFYICLAGISRC